MNRSIALHFALVAALTVPSAGMAQSRGAASVSVARPTGLRAAIRDRVVHAHGLLGRVVDAGLAGRAAVADAHGFLHGSGADVHRLIGMQERVEVRQSIVAHADQRVTHLAGAQRLAAANLLVATNRVAYAEGGVQGANEVVALADASQARTEQTLAHAQAGVARAEARNERHPNAHRTSATAATLRGAQRRATYAGHLVVRAGQMVDRAGSALDSAQETQLVRAVAYDNAARRTTEARSVAREASSELQSAQQTFAHIDSTRGQRRTAALIHDRQLASH